MILSSPVFPLMTISRLRMGIDGKGVTTLVCSPGCPLHCRYCINKKILAENKFKNVTAKDLVEKVRCDHLYYCATGGGITFGGGESLLQASFFSYFKEVCPKEWRLCAETSLSVPQDMVALATKSIDEFIVDCKDMDPVVYNEYTGGDESLMESNLRFLIEKAGPERVVVRVPLIPGYNDGEKREKSIEKLKAMGVERMDIFSYVVRE